jgi:hypothetical protein
MHLYDQIRRVIFVSYCQSIVISDNFYHLGLYNVFIVGLLGGGGESIIEKFNLFNPKIQVLYQIVGLLRGGVNQ